MAKRLPIITINGRQFYLDQRLGKSRAVDNPHDRIEVNDSFINKSSTISREQFLDYYRSDQYSQEMSADDCLEVFLGSIKGSSDLTQDNMSSLFSDYSEEYPVPALIQACNQVIEQNDCKCDEGYVCSVCACINAVDLANAIG